MAPHSITMNEDKLNSKSELMNDTSIDVQRERTHIVASASVDCDVMPDKVAHVRSHLREEHRNVDEATIQRFIRATGGNLSLSTKRLSATLDWRNHNKPDEIVCYACPKDPRSHYMHLVGFDYFHRPVIYSCLANASNKVYSDNYNHMIQTFEMAVKCMSPSTQQWVWVCDFHGFGTSDINPKLAKTFLDVSAEYYPERLGLFMVVGAPTLFNVLWKAISSFVDPKTYQKIKFLPCDLQSASSKLLAEMKQQFDPALVQWLSREMMENRDKKKVLEKVYDIRDVYKCAKSGQLAEADGQSSNGAHNVQGSRALLAAYAANPSLLEPQATAPVVE